MTKRIVLFFAQGAHALDVTGPAAVFSGANTAVTGDTPYEIVVASLKGGLVNTISGVQLGAKPIDEIVPRSVDTLLIAGHDRSSTEALIDNMSARRWVTAVAQTARRWGSVCSGAFPLAAWGMLDGKTAATHWGRADDLAKRFPKIKVDAESLFATDGNIWTSAGVTAGIDMSLALVEADLGKDVAIKIARGLVVYLKRPGYQSQFSTPLRQQYMAAPKYSDLISWASTNLKERLTVDVLAERMGQSPRTFQRHFTRQFGQPPAMVIEDLRLEQSKALIADDVPLQIIAAEVGYSSATQLTSVFQRRYGVPPSMWKMLHS